MSGWRATVVAVLGLIVLSILVVQRPEDGASTLTPATTNEVAAGTEPIVIGSGTATRPAAAATASSARRPSGSVAVPGVASAECVAGRNGGATEVGVTPNRIRLAATNVRSGVGSSFLGQSHTGMEAVVAKVNARGGICGRLLELRLVDDGWDANRGRQYIENFIREGYFALPVVPSSEGLTAAITSGVIRRAGIPVIGSDGMLKEQYQDAWVWPVATATVTTMRVMAKHAHGKGARSFGIVYDNQYKFGIEGAAAFRTYVQSLSGAKLKAFVGIPPLRPSYGPEANAFNEQCDPACDFVAFLLEPSTAEAWVASQPEENGRKKGFGRMLSGGGQPLFNERFARNCGQPCNGMLVWTGYNPPVGPIADEADVDEYIRDVRAIDPGADVTNQFLEGAYLGMRVFVDALKQTGPLLTRPRLRKVMDSMTYKSDLASVLQWRPTSRFANLFAQGFEIVTASGSFAGFRDAGTGFLRDPTPGVVPRT